jgi:hypothetical protein
MNSISRATDRPHADRAAVSDTPPSDAAFAQLRDLLLGDEQAQLARLRQRVEEPQLRTADVSRVLAQAVALRSADGPELAAALTPSVEAALATSIRRDPQVLANAIFPIIGPAIRKSIAAALQSMTQSLEQAMAHSLSLQGLKWRIEAARTGRPFAEIVMLHTLLYRVEQVFLIDRHAGLLMQHAAATEVVVRDADMVSGMLSAIQDFVRDSFGNSRSESHSESLDSLQVGGLTVWVEQGPFALLAGVVRGTPPQALRERFRQTIEGIHQTHGAMLENFDGNAATLESTQVVLQACLEAQYGKALPGHARGKARGNATVNATGNATDAHRVSPLMVGAALLALSLATLAFFHVRQSMRWEHYVKRLRTEPGLVVTLAVKEAGRYHVAGLRDALATDPQTLLQNAGLDPHDFQFTWEPYLSLRPEFVRRREQALRLSGLAQSTPQKPATDVAASAAVGLPTLIEKEKP